MTTTSDSGGYDQKVRAYEMVTRRDNALSVRAAAEELGVSKSTVQRWVREIQAADDYIDLLDVAEVRVGQAFRLDEYVKMLRHRVDKEGRPIEQIFPHLLAAEKFVAELLGTKVPSRMQVEQTGPSVPMDPKVIAAIKEAKRMVAAERENAGGDDA